MILITTQKFLITALNSQKLSCYEHHWELLWCCGWCDTAPWTATAASSATCVHVSVSHGWMSCQAKFRAAVICFTAFIFCSSSKNFSTKSNHINRPSWPVKEQVCGQMLGLVCVIPKLHVCQFFDLSREKVLITAEKNPECCLSVQNS